MYSTLPWFPHLQNFWIRHGAILPLTNSASEMTYIVSSGALNSTHSLTHPLTNQTLSDIIHSDRHTQRGRHVWCIERSPYRLSAPEIGLCGRSDRERDQISLRWRTVAMCPANPPPVKSAATNCFRLETVTITHFFGVWRGVGQRSARSKAARFCARNYRIKG